MPTEQEKIRAIPWSLAFGITNSIFCFWTFGGSLFVLFLAALGLPKGQIGLLLSLFPFCGPIALFFAPAATRLGRKKIFLICNACRHPIIALLLLLPWIVIRYGHSAAMLFLAAVCIVFAVLRALAETALYPWMQEAIPNRIRGRFAAWSAVLGLATATAALAVASLVLSRGTGLGRYLFLLGTGSVIGALGTVAVINIPGGAPIPPVLDSPSHRGNMREALRDRNFCAYLGGVAGLMIGTAILISFLPLYVKEQLAISVPGVMHLDMAGMVGGALASLGWGVLSDRYGSRPVLMSSIVVLLLLPLAWLLLPRQGPHIVGWCMALYILFGAANNGIAIASGRLLFNGVIPPEKNTAYTAIHYAVMGVTGGLAPLLAGTIFGHCLAKSTQLFPGERFVSFFSDNCSQ